MQQHLGNNALFASVLVLNRYYMAIHVVNVRRAFALLYRDLAEVVNVEEGHYANYDFESWLLFSELNAEARSETQDWIRSVHFEVQVPRIVRLLRYDRLPRLKLRFSRRNLFARDQHQCQYCGSVLPPNKLSMDHVVPRSQGGSTDWDNIVCCCLDCNTRKGGRTPQEARMNLIRQPSRPGSNPILARKLDNPKYRDWKTFLRSGSLAVEFV